MRLCELLAVPRGITSVVGGGGKTALIARLARELSQGARVLCATTTRVWLPEGALLAPTAQSLGAAFLRSNLVYAGEACPNGKMTAPNTPIEALAALADYTLVEADGSRGLSVKAPEEYEPALLGAESLVIGVAGVSGLGRPIGDAAHRPQRYAALVGKSLDDPITAEDMALALGSERGQRKNVRCRYLAVINQCDEDEQARAAQACAKLLECDCALLSLQNRPEWCELYRAGQRMV